jgi:omega-3 fatty acid desaturase (delta-15 desaturase)
VLADFVRTLIGCHFVEKGNGKEVWKSAYPFAANHSAPKPEPRDSVPAE